MGSANASLAEAPFEVGGIPDVRAHMDIPPRMVAHALRGREACMDFFPGDTYTIDQMKSTCRSKAKGLRQMEPSISLSLAFLFQHAEPMLVEKVKSDISERLPDATRVKSATEAIGSHCSILQTL